MATARFLIRSFGLAALALALGVLSVVVWVALYSEAIAPGLGEPFYRGYANRIAPIIGILTGIPLLILAGWWAARMAGGGWRAGMAVGIAYAVIDLPLLAALSAGPIPWGYVVLSYASKIASAAIGGWIVGRRRLASA